MRIRSMLPACWFVVFGSLGGGTASCFGAEPVFERDVLPILTSHCLACHGGVTQKNDLDMRTSASLLKGGKSGPAVVAGHPEKSLLWKMIEGDTMPRNDNKVSARNKEILKRWIQAGTPASEVARAFTPPKKASSPAAVAKQIDREIAARLAAAKVAPAPRADDAEFLRRATLDITGRIPTASEAREFLASAAPDRREQLIERLLSQPHYGQNFATEFVNAFRRISMNTTGRRLNLLNEYTQKLGRQLHEGRPWDELVRDAVAYSGPYTKETPEPALTYLNFAMNGEVSVPTLTGNLSQVLLGLQLQCAECHNHPYSDWKQTDFWGLAAFFGNLKIVNTGLGEVANKKVAPSEGAAITIPSGGARNAGKKVTAKFMLAEEPNLAVEDLRRPAFAAWLTSRDNPFFARAYANRMWAHFFGRGFVNPLDDFSDANPPSHPEILELLAGEFAASGFDVRHLIRCICLTDAYQRSSRVASGGESDPAMFARMAIKVMTPEMLYDSLCIALEAPQIVAPNEPILEKVDSETGPQSARARFVRFYRGVSSSENRTEYTFGVTQALRLMNQTNFADGGRVVARLLKGDPAPPERVIETLFLNSLSRYPDVEEPERYLAFVRRQSSTEIGYNLVLWTLINSPEFVAIR
jgi:hypothetical protein